MSHYYTLDGKPCHEQHTKPGAKNKTRPTNVADARRLKLLPSVTDITKQAYNPILERWKLGMLADTCFANPPIFDEQIEGWRARMMELAFDTEAADLGVRIHDALETSYKRPGAPIDADLIGYVDNVRDVIDGLGITVVESECVVTNPEEGYAGTMDIAWTRRLNCGVLDFKSTKTKKNVPVEPRQGQGAQIAAYLMAYWTKNEPILDQHKGYNVYISTTEPGRIEVKEWTAQELREEYEWFQACCLLWRRANGYDPRTLRLDC